MILHEKRDGLDVLEEISRDLSRAEGHHRRRPRADGANRARTRRRVNVSGKAIYRRPDRTCGKESAGAPRRAYTLFAASVTEDVCNVAQFATGPVHWVFVTFAIAKSTLPLPPPVSTRILASMRLPSVIPAVFQALKWSEMVMVLHWRAFCRILQNCVQLEALHLEPPVPFVGFE